MTNQQPDKGGRTEEALREYFLKAGYYAARGVPFVYGDTDVTDVDIWLYIRPSPLGRERVSVDAKDRGKPKALERILWAKGLQAILGFERCIVATTDRRPVVRKFGDQNNVLVLDGNMLSRLTMSSTKEPSDRISEEEFLHEVEADDSDRFLGKWRSRMVSAKALLLNSLGFDGCNSWLEDFYYFANETTTSSRRATACRLSYLVLSYLLLGIDYSMRTLAFEPPEERRRALQEGFRYGSNGRDGVDRALSLATTLIETYAPDAGASGSQMRARLANDAGLLKVDILAEYFTRPDIFRDLFGFAKAFEAHAFARVFTPPHSLEPSLQGIVGVVLDFLGMDRVSFFKSNPDRSQVRGTPQGRPSGQLT